MKRVLFVIALACGLTLHAQTPEQISLESSPSSEIFVYHPSGNAPSPVIVIFPGGGYQNLAMDHEGHSMAKWYLSNGFTAVVVKYGMPAGKHTVPLADAEKAISTVRANAAKWNINPAKVGIVGSSAGGHLAASLSTLAADENRPNFAILYYPVISFEDGVTHAGSKANLLGSNVNDPKLVERYTLEKQVDKKTPPTLLLLSDDDKAVIPENSLRYYAALNKLSIPAAMYIFPTGGHGWGFRTDFRYHEDTKRLISEWLKEIGIIN